MRTAQQRIWQLRIQRYVFLLLLIAIPIPSLAAPEDVTTHIENGTLFIKRAPGSTDGFFGVGIALEGMENEDIRLSVNGNLQEKISRQGISAIDIHADQSSIDLGRLQVGGVFEFTGDIRVDVNSGGGCFLNQLDLIGDLHLAGTAGRIRVEYLNAIIEGNVTLMGGPGGDIFSPSFSSGFLAINGGLYIDGGPGGEGIELKFAFVTDDVLIDLGPSSGPNDSDYCECVACTFLGSVAIESGEGQDSILLVGNEIGGDLLVDLGNGEDGLFLLGLTLSPASMLFLDGGSGNSDSLVVLGFPIQANEFARFEEVTIP